MLTKELLCYRTYRGKITPKLIDPEEVKLLRIAEELISIFSSSIGDIREKLEASTKQYVDTLPINNLLGRGLEKILLDRTEFDIETKSEFFKLREKIFHYSFLFIKAKYQSVNSDLKNSKEFNFEKYRSLVAQEIGLTVDQVESQLYGDLPPMQKIINFKAISAAGLLHRYNCSQIQGLLLRCEKITIILNDAITARLRQLFKYLRFNKLLCKISRNDEFKDTIFLEIDGPMSIFVNSTRYGLNLANFFPAILHQKNWILVAEVRMGKNKTYTLELNQDCQIRSHYKHFLSYVPKEIDFLSKQIEFKIPSWKMTSATDYLELNGESVCFPDYLLTHNSGKKVQVEIFHTWHSAPLLQRLQQLDSQNSVPLILGVKNSLLKNEELVKKLESSTYFSNFGFYFREVPTVTKLMLVLDKCLKFI